MSLAALLSRLLLFLLTLPLVCDSAFRLLYLVCRLRPDTGWQTQEQTRAPSAHDQTASPSEHRIAVVIPAHNEAGVIGDTVRRVLHSYSTARQDTVFVIADNCADDTADVARTAGADVWVRSQREPRGKGAVVSWFLTAARERLQTYDTVLILDADSVVSPGYLPRLAPALTPGAVVQSFIQPLTSSGEHVVSLGAYSELLSQSIDDMARLQLGWPAPLRGTGMALPTALLTHFAPKLRTRIEDTELSLLLTDKDVPISFVPDAALGDPKPLDANLVARQRARWLQGRFELLRLYGPVLIRLLLSLQPGKMALVLTLLLRPKTVVLGVKVLLATGLLALGQRRSLTRFWGWVLALAAVIDSLYYIIGLRFVASPRPYARALLSTPRFLLLWLRSLKTALTSSEHWLSARRQAGPRP